ncbi:dihydroneopterin aldolase [Terrihabitans sp. B22-R8]|uniref:dihydroneopterin aldolase n=1 Tax=Terrihabitans sp. B22-R8 TaxID=3425128 RepID=UPI00403D0873
MNVDRIKVSNLALFAYHGVFEGEQEIGQRFYLDVMVEADLAPAAQSDAVEKTVDYAALVKVIDLAFTEQRQKLLETLASRVAERIFESFPIVQATEITIRKPSAPIEAVFDSVEIHIRRVRHG